MIRIKREIGIKLKMVKLILLSIIKNFNTIKNKNNKTLRYHKLKNK